MVLSDDDKRQWMQRVPLFRGCSPGALALLAERLGEIHFRAGQHMVTQGQVGNGLYMLVSGTAEVRRGDEVIAVLEPMDVFGELAVLDQKPRDATVVALGPVTALALASWDLIAALEEDPQLALNLLRELAGRIRVFENRHVN